ncbi:MAG: nitroreductase family protein [Ilumatobacteraceae bacterium]
MTELSLTPFELLSTTRAVRKRLDFDRPVDDDVVRRCVDMALQAPSGSNDIKMRFVVIRDPELRKGVGDVYRDCFDMYRQMDGVYAGSLDKGSEEANAQQARVVDSAEYLAQHMGEAPVLVLGCYEGMRVEAYPPGGPSFMGSVLPGMWSFMLAARALGLGTSWTTVHLFQEQRVAELLGIPHDSVQQACLTPLAYTKGTDFKPAARPPADTFIHWDRW